MDRAKEEAALSELVHETVRLNGSLHLAWDRMTDDLGLTGARWQILRAIDDRPASVAQIARLMGQSRQAVQRIANVLVEEGFAAFGDNPDHKRAKLLHLSDEGRSVLEQANRRYARWTGRLAANFGPDSMESALWLLQTVRRRLVSAERQKRR